MKIRRFKVQREWIQGEEAIITDRGEIRHISKVFRLKPGDEAILFDGEGKEYHTSITRLSPREISFRLLRESSQFSAESPLRIILGFALLKSSKIDWLIQKTTELGVSEILPFHSLHVVPRWREEEIQAKQSRWKKIASEAAKQCGRAKIPRVHSPRSFAEALAAEFEDTTRIFLWEKEQGGSPQDILGHPASGFYVLVGPEGGFSDPEALQAQEAGFRPIRLGPRILRAETAGVVIVSLLQFLLGDLK